MFFLFELQVCCQVLSLTCSSLHLHTCSYLSNTSRNRCGTHLFTCPVVLIERNLWWSGHLVDYNFNLVFSFYYWYIFCINLDHFHFYLWGTVSFHLLFFHLRCVSPQGPWSRWFNVSRVSSRDLSVELQNLVRSGKSDQEFWFWIGPRKMDQSLSARRKTGEKRFY